MSEPGTLLAGALLFQFVLNILFIFSKFGKLVHGWQVLCFFNFLLLFLFDILRFSKSHVPIRLAGALLFSIFQYSLQILHISQPGTWLADTLFLQFFCLFCFCSIFFGNSQNPLTPVRGLHVLFFFLFLPLFSKFSSDSPKF